MLDKKNNEMYRKKAKIRMRETKREMRSKKNELVQHAHNKSIISSRCCCQQRVNFLKFTKWVKSHYGLKKIRRILPSLDNEKNKVQNEFKQVQLLKGRGSRKEKGTTVNKEEEVGKE